MAAAPVGVNPAGAGVSAPNRSAAETQSAPAAEALAGRKPSRFSLLLASLLRAGRGGSGSASRLQSPVSSKEEGGPGRRGPAAKAGQAPRRSPAQTAAFPANQAASGRSERVRKEEPELRMGQAAARRAVRRKQSRQPEALTLVTEKKLQVGRNPAPDRRAEARSGAGQRAEGVAKASSSARPRVFVVDLRRPARPSGSEPLVETAARRPGAGEPLEREAAGESATGLRGTGFERQLARAVREASPQDSQQPPLFRALQERVIPQIVQRTGIILRDGGEGEIRLVLKPEHLGAVRVRLHLGESSLEGRIVVDNNIVKELLEANLEHLRNALRQEGFASPNIEVSVGGGRPEGRAPEDREPVGGPLPAAAGERAREFEASTPLAWEAGLGYSTVNIWI